MDTTVIPFHANPYRDKHFTGNRNPNLNDSTQNPVPHAHTMTILPGLGHQKYIYQINFLNRR